MTRPYIDPINHAWRHCNPQTPFPSVLGTRSAVSGLPIDLHSSRGQLVDEGPRTRQEDVQHGFLAVAISPWISPADEVSDEGASAE